MTPSGDWIRVLDEEAIVELPATAFDAALARACKNGDWTQTRYVLARLLAEEFNLPHEVRPAAR